MEEQKVVFDQEAKNIFREACSERNSPLGKGVGGSVYLASYKGKTYAVKKLQLPMKKMDWRERYAKREVRILKILMEFENDSSKVNLVKIYDSWQDGRLIYIVMEFCNQGNLADYVKVNGDEEERLSEEKAFNIFSELVNGYYLLYRHRIVHRDLKPENILINGGVSKLADLGMAKQQGTESTTMQSMMVGNDLFRPPFVDKTDEWTNDTEVWSFGLLLLAMLLGKKFVPILVHNIRKLHETGIIDTPILKHMLLQPRTKILLELMIHINDQQRMKWPDIFDLILGANPTFLLDESIDIILEQYQTQHPDQYQQYSPSITRAYTTPITQSTPTLQSTDTPNSNQSEYTNINIQQQHTQHSNRLKSEFDLKVKYTTNYLRQFIDKIKDSSYPYRKIFQDNQILYENVVLALSLLFLNIIKSLLHNLNELELAKEIPLNNLQKLQQYFKLIEDKQIAIRQDYVLQIQKLLEVNIIKQENEENLKKFQFLCNSILTIDQPINNTNTNINLYNTTQELIQTTDQLFKFLDHISDQWIHYSIDFFKFLDDLFFFSTPINDVVDLLLDKHQDIEHYFNQRCILSNEDFKNEVFEEIKERIS